MQYKVVPFVGTLDQNKKFSSQHVAEQLEGIISKHSTDGWTYVRLESVSTYVAPDNGCFGIIGAKPGYSIIKILREKAGQIQSFANEKELSCLEIIG